MSHTFTFVTGCPVTVYVQEHPRKASPLVVEHNVLDATHSTFQYLGAKSPERVFQFMVYGQYWIDYIDTMVTSGSVFIYTDDKGTSGSYLGRDLNHNRKQALNYADTWHECTMQSSYLAASGSLYYQ